ncbi:hypothetical protein CY35_13G036200 [Sphagnum magellanicum]|jgi:hypothetical protein|nr:hypothetical protein CY35_13G036200 [Sphagnum magellanicum]
MSSFKLSPVVITTVFVFVALMSMQLIAASSVEGAAHTNENHGKLKKSRFWESKLMEGGSRKMLQVIACNPVSCPSGQYCCYLTNSCQNIPTDPCRNCNFRCTSSLYPDCCSGQCVNFYTSSTNCGSCGHACTNATCTLGICA